MPESQAADDWFTLYPGLLDSSKGSACPILYVKAARKIAIFAAANGSSGKAWPAMKSDIVKPIRNSAGAR